MYPGVWTRGDAETSCTDNVTCYDIVCPQVVTVYPGVWTRGDAETSCTDNVTCYDIVCPQVVTVYPGVWMRGDAEYIYYKSRPDALIIVHATLT